MLYSNDVRYNAKSILGALNLTHPLNLVRLFIWSLEEWAAAKCHVSLESRPPMIYCPYALTPRSADLTIGGATVG